MARALSGLLAVATLLGASPAHAGALGDVIGGLFRASGTTPGNNSNNGGSSGSSAGDVVGGVLQGLGEAVFGPRSSTSSNPAETLTMGSGVVVPPSPGPSAQVYFYFGAQAVDDSDNSLSLELRAGYRDFAVGVRGTSYFERTGDPANPYVSLDLWMVSAGWRLLHGRNALWVEGGIGGINAIDQLTMTGIHAGLRGERRLGGEISALASARMFWLEDNVFAAELSAGVRAYVFQLSYRILDFNVGPPLKGPEVGVVLTF